MVLDNRSDLRLFDVLQAFFSPEAGVLDPNINYETLLGAELLFSTVRNLQASFHEWESQHWNPFVTLLASVAEALLRQIYSVRYAAMGFNQDAGEKRAKGEFANMLAIPELKNTYGTLQALCNTLQNYRQVAATAHAMNRDGTAKAGATDIDAARAREVFQLAFEEFVRILR
jgi:hypothetical protein